MNVLRWISYKGVLSPYAYLTAINLIKGGAINNSLIICSETYRKFISKKNHTCGTVFSDGASAFFLNKRNLPKILSSYTYSDGDGAKNLCLKKFLIAEKNFLCMGVMYLLLQIKMFL